MSCIISSCLWDTFLLLRINHTYNETSCMCVFLNGSVVVVVIVMKVQLQHTFMNFTCKKRCTFIYDSWWIQNNSYLQLKSSEIKKKSGFPRKLSPRLLSVASKVNSNMPKRWESANKIDSFEVSWQASWQFPTFIWRHRQFEWAITDAWWDTMRTKLKAYLEKYQKIITVKSKNSARARENCQRQCLHNHC